MQRRDSHEVGWKKRDQQHDGEQHHPEGAQPKMLQAVRTRWIDYESVAPRDRLGLPFLDADTRAALRRLGRVLRG